tara:strand:+ start:37 stop:600 length:564 start_codon:yes stop_codon:yes gene_type:complete
MGVEPFVLMDKGRINRKNKGFSLIELVIVIAVLSILGAIAFPYFDSLRKKAMIAALKENITTITKECLVQDLLDETKNFGTNYRDRGWNNSNTSFSDNGGIDHGSTGYPYYFISLGFRNPLSLDDNCLSISARSKYINNTSIGELPHFQIFFNSGEMRFEKLCTVDSERTFNNGTCDLDPVESYKMW